MCVCMFVRVNNTDCVCMHVCVCVCICVCTATCISDAHISPLPESHTSLNSAKVSPSWYPTGDHSCGYGGAGRRQTSNEHAAVPELPAQC